MKVQAINNVLTSEIKPVSELKKTENEEKKIEWPNEIGPFNPKVFNKVEQFMDLGTSSKVDMEDLSKSEKDLFLKILSKLMEDGVVGYKYFEIKGKIEKHFVLSNMQSDSNKKEYA